MATTSGFKQQCPSCEAWVPIRDTNLIGRKIDCPKCKYRFVVEDPGTATDEAEEAAEQPAKKAKGKPEEAVTSKRALGSAAGRRPRDEEEEEGAGPKKGRRKTASKSPKLVLGLALGLIGIVLLCVVGYFIFVGSDSGSGGSTAGSGGGTTPVAGVAPPGPGAGAQPEGGAEAEKKEAKAPPALPDSSDLATNLLPNDVDAVLNVNLREVVSSPIGRAIFDSAGAFQQQAVEQKLGFRIADVDRVLWGTNFSQVWTFLVIHSSKPFAMDAVKHAWNCKPGPESPVQGQEYFVSDAGGKVLTSLLQSVASAYPGFKLPPGSATANVKAVRFPDAQTMVVADLAPMKSFLQVNGRPALKTQPPTATESAPKPPEGGEGGREGGRPGMMAGPAGPGGPGGPPGMMPGGPGSPDAGRGPGGRGQVGGGDAEAPAVPPSRAYLTLDPAMKAMLDRLESKGPVLASTVVNAGALMANPVVKAAMAGNPAMKEAGELQIVGFAVALKDGATFALGMEAKTLEGGRTMHKQLQAGAPALAKGLSEFLDTKFEVVDEQQEGQGNPAFPNAPGMMPGGMGPGGMGPAGMGPAGVAGPGGMFPGRGDAGGPGPRGMFPGRGGPGRFGPGGMGDGGEGRGTAGAFGGRPGGLGGLGGQEVPEGPPSSTVQVELQDKVVVLTVHYLMDQKAYDKMMALIQPQVRQLKGRMDMVGGQSRLHELAAAVRAIGESKAQFPRGTADRTAKDSGALAKRHGRPYPPDLRISWMAELLPYLGHEEIYRRIAWNKAWRDPENVSFATTLIPQFIDPQYPQNSWWVRYPGLKELAAATHFVGLAGIGLDAAEYTAIDPATLPKLGVFGYDRETRLADITDGLSNTIVLAQVPPTFKRPWMASGGSTVQGVPETHSVQPFVSTQYNGKKGTYVIMADGSVRFVPENISDEVFKAMVTIKGGETVLLNQEAPVVPRPEEQQPELKVQPVASGPGLQPAAVSPPPPPTEKKPEPQPNQPSEAKPPESQPGSGGQPK